MAQNVFSVVREPFEMAYDAAPTMLLFGDDQREIDRIGATASAHGYRIAGAGPLAGAAERLGQQVAVDLVWLVLQTSSVEAEALAVSADMLARVGYCRAAISFPVAMIDSITGLTGADDTYWLCDADMAEQLAVLSLAAMPRPVTLHDVAAESEMARLRRVSEEVSRIARTLAALSGGNAQPRDNDRSAPGGAGVGDPPVGFMPPPGLFLDDERDGVSLAGVRAEIRRRRLRERHFNAELFADPAWDMLLDLMAARIERKPVSVSSLCLAAHVPSTTALRWIRTMTEAGLFERQADPGDGRRVYISLSDDAARAMAAYFADAQRGG